VAVSCSVNNKAILTEGAVIAIDCKMAGVMVRLALPVTPFDEPLTPFDEAVMTAVPGCKAVARPVELIEVVAVEDELQIGD